MTQIYSIFLTGTRNSKCGHSTSQTSLDKGGGGGVRECFKKLSNLFPKTANVLDECRCDVLIRQFSDFAVISWWDISPALNFWPATRHPRHWRLGFFYLPKRVPWSPNASLPSLPSHMVSVRRDSNADRPIRALTGRKVCSDQSIPPPHPTPQP